MKYILYTFVQISYIYDDESQKDNKSEVVNIYKETAFYR